jgi:3(or 17)beta-hydroxysteroid dehydrogenase
VNNAGVGAREAQPFDDISLDEWQRVMRVNLEGAFLGTRAGVRAMKLRGGSIVNIGSIAGVIGTRGGAAYGASKGGVHALTRQAAYSCGKHKYNVRVNSILPSYVWTDLVAEKALKEFGSKEKAMAAFAERNLLGRMNEPDDIAWAVLFLACDESRQITGIELVIDGGQLIS